MGRASEDALAEIHGVVASGLKELITSEDPRERIKGLDMAMKFLKDNQITVRMEASPDVQSLQKIAQEQTKEDLEKLMRLTPDDA